MTARRDDFAKAALTGLLANPDQGPNDCLFAWDPKGAAQHVVEHVDALIAELDRTKEKGMEKDGRVSDVCDPDSNAARVPDTGVAPVSDPLTITALRDGQEVMGRLEWQTLAVPGGSETWPHIDFGAEGGIHVLYLAGSEWSWRFSARVGSGFGYTTIPESQRAKVRAFIEAGPPKEESDDIGRTDVVSDRPQHRKRESEHRKEEKDARNDEHLGNTGEKHAKARSREGGTPSQEGDSGGTEALRGADAGRQEVAPSPADGPTKVFENETEAFGHLIAGPRDWRGKQADEWLKLRGVNVEGVMLKALPRILERLPAEQVVGAMGEEARSAIIHALYAKAFRSWDQSDGVTEELALSLIDQRDEALARAESLRDRLATIIDEAFGLHPVMDADGLLTTLEQQLHESHRNHEGAIAREQGLIAAKERAETKLRRQSSTMAHYLDAVADAAEHTLESLGVIRLRGAIERARISNGQAPGLEFAEALARAEKTEEERDEWKHLAQERKVLIDRATGALTDSAVAPTYPPEAGILALTAERDQALARAEKAESVRDDATERAARYQRHWATEVERAEQAERERDRLQKLFDDAGQGEHNVLALIDHYQRNSMEADDRLRAVRKLLEENGCDCPCDHHADERGPDCEVCLACRIGEAVGK